ncbi:MAG: PD-(D/E)XK nuclease domain-containing protein, partial [Tannerella sp.]|nr:PD-(D/E)XK nuclease domain-containing protein [Tannerella sp.]
VHRFIRYVSENAFGKLSDYDLQRFDEKYIKVLMLAYLFMSKIYIPMSEYETVPGRADIFLQRNPLNPEVRYEWVFEIKYCKTSAGDGEIAAKRSEGLEQLTQYIHSHRMKDRPDLKAALIVFTGKNKFEITETQM